MSTIPLIPPPIGYLAPVSTNNELNDQRLREFLQTLVVGITLMLPTLVFPRWQENPPDQPPYGTDWAAIGEIDRTHDTFAAVIHSTDPDDFENSLDTVYRNQVLEIVCSFYGPNCQKNAELFAMGLSIAQNREAMELNGFALVEVSDSRNVPAIIKNRWVAGADVELRLRRQQNYEYEIPNLVAIDADLYTDVGYGPVPIWVGPRFSPPVEAEWLNPTAPVQAANVYPQQWAFDSQELGYTLDEDLWSNPGQAGVPWNVVQQPFVLGGGSADIFG